MGHISVRIAEPFGAVAAAVSEGGLKGPAEPGAKCKRSVRLAPEKINHL